MVACPRPASRRAVFLDRDGVIVRGSTTSDGWEQLEVLPGVLKTGWARPASRWWSTNRRAWPGYFSLTRLALIHRGCAAAWPAPAPNGTRSIFAHGPDSGHVMRKPGVGMLKAAARR